MLKQPQLKFFKKVFNIPKHKVEKLFDELYFDNKFLTKKEYSEFFNLLIEGYQLLGQTDSFIRNYFSVKYNQDFYYKVKFLLTDYSLLKVWDVLEKINLNQADEEFFKKINEANSPYELPASYDSVLKKIQMLVDLLFFTYCLNNHKKYEDIMIEIIKEVGYSYLISNQFYLLTITNLNDPNFMVEINTTLNDFHSSLSKDRDKRKWLTYFLIEELKNLGFGTTTIFRLMTKILQFKTGNSYTDGGVERNYYRFIEEFKKQKLKREELIQIYNLENELHSLIRLAIRLNTNADIGIIERR